MAIVTEADAEVYSLGPAQSYADLELPKGELVTMKVRGKSWSEIVLADGRTMTIASDEIRMAEEDDFQDPPPPPPLPLALIAGATPRDVPPVLAPIEEAALPQRDTGGLEPASTAELLLIPTQP